MIGACAAQKHVCVYIFSEQTLNKKCSLIIFVNVSSFWPHIHLRHTYSTVFSRKKRTSKLYSDGNEKKIY